jgi:sulfite oxidase
MTLYDKHRSLTVHTEEPFNAGPPLDLLGLAQITPTGLFFVRNHAPVPDIDPSAYRLQVGGMVDQPLSLSLSDLRHFQPRTIISTMQCAGNRRKQLSEVAPIPNEVIWDNEAISTAEWTGVPLREVLQTAGAHGIARHVAFTGLDQVEKGGETFGFGGSIPFHRAMQPDVLLAYQMNGEPIPAIHGAPIRVVVPGYIGARSVKWLGEINVQATPSDNYYQAHAYKLFPPSTNEHNVDWKKGLMLGELHVHALVFGPTEGERVRAGDVLIHGFALSGGRAIERVDVSADGGKTWHTAELLSQPGEREQPWAWRFWRIRLPLEPGAHQIIARAWDEAANTQPESAATCWNFKGYMNNAWHRVNVNVE